MRVAEVIGRSAGFNEGLGLLASVTTGAGFAAALFIHGHSPAIPDTQSNSYSPCEIP